MMLGDKYVYQKLQQYSIWFCNHYVLLMINFFLPLVYLQPAPVEAEWILYPRKLTENIDYTGYDYIAKVRIVLRKRGIYIYI